MKPSRVLTVSNRLPITARLDHGVVRLTPSSGGLATALRGWKTDMLWFGWSGLDVARLAPKEAAALDEELARRALVPIDLSASEVAHYYDAFSNGVLWPLLHYQVDKVRLDAEHDWSVYCAVNRRFAEMIARRYRPGDIVLVHDYQLTLVPQMVRELVPNATVGFFLHVPFPASDVFRILPWRREIIDGIMGADLVGFHTKAYGTAFVDTASTLLSLDATTAEGGSAASGDAPLAPVDGLVRVLRRNGRTVRVAAHPIGIDFDDFTSVAKSSEVEVELASLEREARGKRIVLGVDRLDYTKGIPRRLMAFERFLERYPKWRDRVLFIQLAVPSREKVDAYADLRRSVNETVGRINAHYGTTTTAPIRLLYRSIAQHDLVALYRAADAMLVTPLRDGMNLVAKEYVASRIDERGALILSEFAGAAHELTDALVVNPYDLDAIATSIRIALEMPETEQRRRMLALRARSRSNSIHVWAEKLVRHVMLAHEGNVLSLDSPKSSMVEQGHAAAV